MGLMSGGDAFTFFFASSESLLLYSFEGGGSRLVSRTFRCLRFAAWLSTDSFRLHSIFPFKVLLLFSPSLSICSSFVILVYPNYIPSLGVIRT